MYAGEREKGGGAGRNGKVSLESVCQRLRICEDVLSEREVKGMGTTTLKRRRWAKKVITKFQKYKSHFIFLVLLRD